MIVLKIHRRARSLALMLAAGISLLAFTACSKQHLARDGPQTAANGGQQSPVIEMQLPSETETSPFILNDAANAIAQWSHPSGKPVERKNLERMLDLEQRALQHCGDQKAPEAVTAYVYTSEGGGPHAIRSTPPGGTDHALSIMIQENIDEIKEALGEVASKSAPH